MARAAAITRYAFTSSDRFSMTMRSDLKGRLKRFRGTTLRLGPFQQVNLILARVWFNGISAS